MKSDRKLVQHKILEYLINAYKFNPIFKNIPPINDGVLLSSSYYIELDHLIVLINDSICRECVYELQERRFLQIIEGQIILKNDPIEHITQFVKHIYITELGISAYRSIKLKTESEELKIQEDFTNASISVSESVKKTNKIQIGAAIMTVFIIAYTAYIGKENLSISRETLQLQHTAQQDTLFRKRQLEESLIYQAAIESLYRQSGELKKKLYSIEKTIKSPE